MQRRPLGAKAQLKYMNPNAGLKDCSTLACSTLQNQCDCSNR
jgi:hypothetical protein